MRRSRSYYTDYENDITFENEEPAEISTETESNGAHTVTATVDNTFLVKVREEPNTESEVLEVLNRGERVTLLDHINLTDSEFYKVSTKKGNIGYIMRKYIKEDSGIYE